MNWLYRFVIYLFVNAARVTLNDGTMDSGADYRDDLNYVRESMECVFSPTDSGISYDTMAQTTTFAESIKVEQHNSFFDFLLTRLRRVMTQITDLPEKHRARLRFSSD